MLVWRIDQIIVDFVGHDRHVVPHANVRNALELPASAAESMVDEVRSDQENLSGFLTVR